MGQGWGLSVMDLVLSGDKGLVPLALTWGMVMVQALAERG